MSFLSNRPAIACGLGIAAVVALVAAAPARAGLGDPLAAVARDRAVLRADAAHVTSMPAYDRHEMVTDDGASIREFTGRDGIVFAVAFDGPAMPDMKTMLGAHFDDYVAAARANRGHRGNHHVLSFASDGIVVTIVKQPRGFTGRAHLPAALPAGVKAEDLR